MQQKSHQSKTRENINRWKADTRRETLFLHKKSCIAFDCFPRSKSTLIGSNIYSNNWDSPISDWDSKASRRKIIARKEDIDQATKVLCIRCPKARFRSYLLSKIVEPHALSILPLFYSDYPEAVRYLCSSIEGVRFTKTLNVYFSTQQVDSARNEILKKINADAVAEKIPVDHRNKITYFLEYAIHAYKKLKTTEILNRLKILHDSNIFLDAHSMSQYSLSTLEFNQYDYVACVDNLNEFSKFYKIQTGYDFILGSSNNSQSNTFITHKEITCPNPDIEYMQARLKENTIPELASILTAGDSLWEHFKLFERDYKIMSEAFNNSSIFKIHQQ